MLAAVGQPYRERQLDRSHPIARGDRDRPPEAAAKRARLGGEEIGTRHARGVRPMALPIDEDLEARHRLVAVKARAAAEHGRGGANGQRRGERALEIGHKIGAHQRRNLSLRPP